MTTIGAVIVTHNSELVFERAVHALLSATVVPDTVVVVDSGSNDIEYLERVCRSDPRLELVKAPTNIGFCAANNLGIERLAAVDFVLLLNPDAFVTTGFLSGAIGALVADPTIGALNPKLLAAEPATGQPTGRIDCAGVFQTAYGKVYDRGQGERDVGQYDGAVEAVPALCAAALLCRRSALEDVAEQGQVFDERFFMYKEDVDLSYRLARAGWRLVLDPSLTVLHCRGWNRTKMPASARRRSVANEWRMWAKGSVPGRIRVPMLGYLVLKSVVVGLGR